MEDVVKFVVPMESLTRSHGPNRMLTEYMTKYQGYVFANLRLSAKTYNAIQGLDLCRSWMGNVNYRRGKKLPPAPIALNELEIQKFGLEDITQGNEEGEDDMDDDDDGIIVDTEEQDRKDANNKPKVNEEQLKDFLGLKVDDMIQVTAKNKFNGEDGIIKRLKGGKIMIRFFTYGTSYDEWLDPSDVRKLGDEEALRGLSGPTKPISQEQFDAGGEGYTERGAQRGGPGSNLRNDLMNSFGGSGDRNRREDRVARGDALKRDLFGRSDGERKREERNWKQHQDRQPGREPSINDGEWNLRSGSHADREVNQADVAGQWGRNSERNHRVERPNNRRENRQVSNAIEANDDWSAFVSSASSPASVAKEDDFFSSLMNELSDDFEKNSPNKVPSSKDDDDFFASLMNELSADEKQNKPGQQRPTQQKQPPAQQLQRPQQQPSSHSKGGVKKEDDFFAALEAELGNVDTKGFLGNDNGDDFFAKLEAEMKPERTKAVADPSRASRGKSDTAQGSDDFFAELAAEMNRERAVPVDVPRRISNGNTDTKPTLAGGDDFFAELEAEMKAEKSRPVDASNKVSKNNEDFFAALENEMATSTPGSTMDVAYDTSLDDFDLESIFGSATPKEPIAEEEKAKKTKSARVVSSDDAKQSASMASPVASSAPSGDLGKHTVPVLKSMLKERGLKVSGSKFELIERLQAAP
jgi:hypothetical protein